MVEAEVLQQLPQVEALCTMLYQSQVRHAGRLWPIAPRLLLCFRVWFTAQLALINFTLSLKLRTRPGRTDGGAAPAGRAGAACVPALHGVHTRL